VAARRCRCSWPTARRTHSAATTTKSRCSMMLARIHCPGWTSSRSRDGSLVKSRRDLRSDEWTVKPASMNATHRIALRVLDERIRPHLPAYATAGSAGMDLRACIDAPLTLDPGQVELVPTGIAIHF